MRNRRTPGSALQRRGDKGANERHEQRQTSAGAEEEKWNRDVRRGFMKKVLFIVFCQLLVTTGITFLFFTVDSIKARPAPSVFLGISCASVFFPRPRKAGPALPRDFCSTSGRPEQ